MQCPACCWGPVPEPDLFGLILDLTNPSSKPVGQSIHFTLLKSTGLWELFKLSFFSPLPALRNRLTGLKPDILLDPIHIGLFGSTGAGKSTLLNAIIDKNFFLPVSGSEACTSCVVQINTSRGKQHEAKIHLLTDEAWIISLFFCHFGGERKGDLAGFSRGECSLLEERGQEGM